MPKSRAKRKKRGSAREGGDIPWGSKAGSGSRRINLILAVLVTSTLLAGGVYWLFSAQSERAFQALAAEGADRLSALVTSSPNLGGGHGGHGTPYSYNTQFPTSGRHDPVPTSPGIYQAPQRPGQLVHALEHGNIVIYHDTLDPDILVTLKDWAGLYGDQWDGLVVVPMEGLDRDVVLTAWTKTLRLQPFDKALAAAFIDAYRGRGPEHPVR